MVTEIIVLQRDSAMFVLEDKDEDSELRIASYLAVMTCPDDITLQRVQLLLESDLEEQVCLGIRCEGFFVKERGVEWG